jgi:hypothetical protein
MRVLGSVGCINAHYKFNSYLSNKYLDYRPVLWVNAQLKVLWVDYRTATTVNNEAMDCYGAV